MVFHDPASHGSYHLSEERIAEMPKALREFKPFAEQNWFEEDSDWAVVPLAFRHFFPADAIPTDQATLRQYRPEVYRQFVTSEPGESVETNQIKQSPAEQSQ
jgi:hypothetical protein